MPAAEVADLLSIARLLPIITPTDRIRSKDGNGDPIPDSPRGIPLLGDGDGKILIPTGKKTGRNQSPSGLAGTGMVVCAPYPIPASPPR